ncbi:MAG: DNA mismatch repair protein MutS [Synergistaceae bacterium]|nr:DNA mismatch repair protein MutS [Synergistaceae bacterium]
MTLPPGIKLTPMLEQYVKWKEAYPDCLLFFRMGDFYEMFFEDANIASNALNIALTSRSKDPDTRIPMAGVPYHSVDSYLARLVEQGYSVAICEQMTEPNGKDLVERQVIRVITPGTYLSDKEEDEARLAAIARDGDGYAIALLEVSTGVLKAGSFSSNRVADFLSSFAPTEILCKKGDIIDQNIIPFSVKNTTERDKQDFKPENATIWLCDKFKVATLEVMGVEDRSMTASVSAVALRYLEETQCKRLDLVKTITPLIQKENLIIDRSTFINLELITKSPTSLYTLLCRARTAMGKRLLKDWIASPLQDLDQITARQDKIEEFTTNMALTKQIEGLLANCSDIARALTRIEIQNFSPQDLASISQTLQFVPQICETIRETQHIKELLPSCDITELKNLLASAIADEVPRNIKDTGVIREGYSAELDRLRNFSKNASDWLTNFEEREKERTGLKILKARYNKVAGFYIEIPKAQAKSAPADYIRRQTLVNAERYITPELKQYEEEVLQAESKILALEMKIYGEVTKAVLQNRDAVRAIATFLAELDTLMGLALVAEERHYTRPKLDMSFDFVVKGARHPIIEATLKNSRFTPNDFNFSESSGRRIAILTGPNMAGKSTYLRSAALITVMAHMGSFVPAEDAHIGLVDRIFSRIGAHDELSRGQSTFMVEMVETANILRNATERSLVILDEVGRGTSTYDGMAIAWSVLEFLQGAMQEKPRVLFATHYHELTDLAQVLPGIINLSMAIEETNDGIVFLHRVVEGAANRSYGIEVARLAGVPSVVLKRSEELLKHFEEQKEEITIPQKQETKQQIQMFDSRQEAILEELAHSDPNNMTPMSALALVEKLRKKAKEILES